MEDAQRHCAVLFVDVAGSTELHRQKGDVEASRCLRELIAAMSVAVDAAHGIVIKSDGDDVLALFQRDSQCVEDAAMAAIQVQRIANERDLSLYVAFHAGNVVFQNVLGRTDIAGMAVNIAARLHKLTPGVPGSIFLAAESAHLLPEGLRQSTRPYGLRVLKGVGSVDVWTLDWNEQSNELATVHVSSGGESIARDLMICQASTVLRLSARDSPAVLGRSRAQCRIVVDDPQVSSRHVHLVFQDARWLVKDVSRNGTWLRDEASGDVLHLQGGEASLPRAGALCLGRMFGTAEAAHCTLPFSIVDP